MVTGAEPLVPKSCGGFILFFFFFSGEGRRNKEGESVAGSAWLIAGVMQRD